MRSEIAFISLANQAGIPVTAGRRLPWLTNKGHLAEPLRGVLPAELLQLLGDLFRSPVVAVTLTPMRPAQLLPAQVSTGAYWS